MNKVLVDILQTLGMELTEVWKDGILNEAVVFVLKRYYECAHDVELYVLKIHYNYAREGETRYFRERYEVDDYLREWAADNCYISLFR